MIRTLWKNVVFCDPKTVLRAVAGAVTGAVLGLSGPATAGELTIFAAASLKGALDEVAADFEASSGHSVTISYAGSAVLARQIIAGAPADVFLSANQQWMDVIAEDVLIADGARHDLLGNRLVLIADSPQPLALTVPALQQRLDGGRLAMGLLTAVPAGIYGKAALEYLGLWSALAPHVAQTDNVRAALALVALGEAPLGVVYATDAKADARVFVAASLPADSHPPIVYPMARLTDSVAAFEFDAFARSKGAAQIFADYGFLTGGTP